MADPGFPPPYPKLRQPTHRPKDMEVLALGLSRTGTVSLYVALKRLGYTCYHMAECGLDVENNSMIYWHEAIDAKFDGKGNKYVGEDFDKMLWRYDAVTDVPCVLFPDELLVAYPYAKIILTTRSVESWVPSIERCFYEVLSWKRWPILRILDQKHIRHYIPILRACLTHWTDGDWEDRAKLPAGFAKHNSHIITAAAISGRSVLEFRAQDGWGPLCEFLGKEIPEEPYPHVNEGDWVKGLHYFIFRIRLLFALLAWAKRVMPVLLVGVAAWIGWVKSG